MPRLTVYRTRKGRIMRFQRLAPIVTTLVLIAATSVVAGDDESTTPGKDLFLQHKCDGCHDIVVAGIAPPEADGDAAEGTEKKKKAPDLSEVGSRLEAEFVHLYLRKKEKLRDKKHRKRFKGSEEDRTVLVDWLMTLKVVPTDEEGTTGDDGSTPPAADGTTP